jgi:uncharacterized protein (TIGR02145 family)
MSKAMTVLSAAVFAVVLVSTAAAQQTGTFTDGRDGQTYKTVKIGEQTWMAENLNYKTDRYWSYGDTIDFNISWCYDKVDSNCVKYGRLYDWWIATTVCPKGWKLPSLEDWNRLVAAAGGKGIAGKKLKSKSGWDENGNGTDDYGFSALPGGFRHPNGSFRDVGNYGGWWTATETSTGFPYNRHIYYLYDSVDEFVHVKRLGFSVRCVKD